MDDETHLRDDDVIIIHTARRRRRRGRRRRRTAHACLHRAYDQWRLANDRENADTPVASRTHDDHGVGGGGGVPVHSCHLPAADAVARRIILYRRRPRRRRRPYRAVFLLFLYPLVFFLIVRPLPPSFPPSSPAVAPAIAFFSPASPYTRIRYLSALHTTYTEWRCPPSFSLVVFLRYYIVFYYIGSRQYV